MSAEQLSTKDRVAEAMAEGLTPVQIVERLSLPRASVYRIISEIRRKLGWQAV